MIKTDFVRSHGLGNDYLVMDAKQAVMPLTPPRIRLICDRNKGVGSDGILLRIDHPAADFAVRILNPDGSEAEKSGNGLRIFAKFLYDHGYTQNKEFTVHTLGGVVKVRLLLSSPRDSAAKTRDGESARSIRNMMGFGETNGKERGPSVVEAVRVEMGRAVIDRSLNTLAIDGRSFEVTSLSVGNPHCVSIVADLTRVELANWGPLIENHQSFPNRTNVQFAQVESRNDVRALIWERGAGHTLASGSSSCAVAVACYDRGLVDDRVTVHMEGGDLTIELNPDLDLVMTGPVEEICSGNFSGDLKKRLAAM